MSFFPWYAFVLLFLLPFVDPRRPFRLLHVDLLVLLAAGIWPLDASMGTKPPAWTAAITAAGLLWLLGRLLWAGFNPRRSSEPLVPLLPTSWLTVIVVVLVCLRICSMAVSPAYVSDVGIAAIIGADLIGEGQGVYDGQVHRERQQTDDGQRDARPGAHGSGRRGQRACGLDGRAHGWVYGRSPARPA